MKRLILMTGLAACLIVGYAFGITKESEKENRQTDTDFKFIPLVPGGIVVSGGGGGRTATGNSGAEGGPGGGIKGSYTMSADGALRPLGSPPGRREGNKKERGDGQRNG